MIHHEKEEGEAEQAFRDGVARVMLNAYENGLSREFIAEHFLFLAAQRLGGKVASLCREMVDAKLRTMQ